MTGIVLEAIQRSTFRYYDIQLFNLGIFNVDTVIEPISISQSSINEYLLRNICNFGIPLRPLSAGNTLRTAGTMVQHYFDNYNNNGNNSNNNNGYVRA